MTFAESTEPLASLPPFTDPWTIFCRVTASSASFGVVTAASPRVLVITAPAASLVDEIAPGATAALATAELASLLFFTASLAIAFDFTDPGARFFALTLSLPGSAAAVPLRATKRAT